MYFLLQLYLTLYLLKFSSNINISYFRLILQWELKYMDAHVSGSSNRKNYFTGIKTKSLLEKNWNYAPDIPEALQKFVKDIVE